MKCSVAILQGTYFQLARECYRTQTWSEYLYLMEFKPISQLKERSPLATKCLEKNQISNECGNIYILEPYSRYVYFILYDIHCISMSKRKVKLTDGLKFV